MTPVTWAWIVSLAGALLFFSAGGLFSVRASTASARGDRQRTRAEREQLRNAMAEAAHQRRLLAALATERDRLRASQAAIEATAREANARAEQAFCALAEVIEQLRNERKRESARRPSLPGSVARGEALRAILERETRGAGFAGAVITDGLGLVVASSGEYADALAAYGAFLAGVGEKTRDALSLRELRQLTLQDENGTLLTVRPIVSAEDQLALVTLSGAARDVAGLNPGSAS